MISGLAFEFAGHFRPQKQLEHFVTLSNLNKMFKLLNVTKTINIFHAHFRFLKKLRIFLIILGIIHAGAPLPKSTLISSYQQQKHLA